MTIPPEYVDKYAYAFDSLHRTLSNPNECTREDVEFVVSQADAYAQVKAASAQYAGLRLMVVMRCVEDYEEHDDWDCDCILYRQVAEKLDARIKLTASYVATQIGAPELIFGDVCLPVCGDMYVIAVNDLFNDFSSENIAATTAKHGSGTAFLIESDVVIGFVTRYASELQRLDQEFHCRAWVKDDVWWSSLPHERGDVDEALIKQYYGNALGKTKSGEQLSIRQFGSAEAL